MNASTPVARRSRRQFLLLAVLFLGPFIAAWLLYFYFPQWQPSGRINHGTLIDPARPLPALNFTDADGRNVAGTQILGGKWSLVYTGGEHCDESCMHELYMTRQVRTRLGRERGRVQRVYVAPDASALAAVRVQLGTEHPDMVWLADGSAPGQQLTDFLRPSQPTAVYLFDPRSNWLMVFPALAAGGDPNTYMKNLYDDLKHLLALSNIG
jgi:hypothetical protein